MGCCEAMAASLKESPKAGMGNIPAFGDVCLLPLPPFQKQRRIDNDQNGPGVVHQSAHNRIQNSCDRKNDGDKVQRQREGQIVFDPHHHTSGQVQKVGDFFHIVIDQRDVCRVYAMSLSTPPMAMPTYAFFRAGASLIPSPIMQTGCPAF